jgi:serine/threonine-protein kinase
MSVPMPTLAPAGSDEATTVPLTPPPQVRDQDAAVPEEEAVPSRWPATAVLAGIGALAIGGVLALVMILRGSGAQAPEAAAGAASAPVVAASAASTVAPQVPSSATVPVTAEPRRPAAASAAKATAPAARTRPAAKPAPTAPAPAETPRAASPDPAPSPGPEMREQPRPATPPARAAASNLADACRDKVFISRELCLAEQCEKPGARNHPLCVQWRADAKLREESRVRD